MNKILISIGLVFVSIYCFGQTESAFLVVETPPQFIGGSDSLKRFINKHIIWPKEVIEKKLSGRVIVSFIVEKDGSITNPELRSPRLCVGCDEEVLRVIPLMPKWKPGQQSGKIIRVKYMLPIVFNPDYYKD